MCKGSLPNFCPVALMNIAPMFVGLDGNLHGAGPFGAEARHVGAALRPRALGVLPGVLPWMIRGTRFGLWVSSKIGIYYHIISTKSDSTPTIAIEWDKWSIFKYHQILMQDNMKPHQIWYCTILPCFVHIHCEKWKDHLPNSWLLKYG